jgi:2'-5' RNA ligase
MMIQHDFESLPAGTQDSEWPAHVTVVPFFTVDIAKEAEAVGVIREIASTAQPIPVRPGKVSSYGLSEDIPVTELDDYTNRLHDLHNRLVQGLGSAGCQFMDLNYALDNYSPHTTHTNRIEVPTKEFTLASLSVVKKLPKSFAANKLIMHVFELGENQAYTFV